LEILEAAEASIDSGRLIRIQNGEVA
jgi:hypothetical protein